MRQMGETWHDSSTNVPGNHKSPVGFISFFWTVLSPYLLWAWQLSHGASVHLLQHLQARVHTHVHPGTSHSLLISESTDGQRYCTQSESFHSTHDGGREWESPSSWSHSRCTPSSFGTRKPRLMGQIWQPLAFHSQLSSCCPLGRDLRGF